MKKMLSTPKNNKMNNNNVMILGFLMFFSLTIMINPNPMILLMNYLFHFL